MAAPSDATFQFVELKNQSAKCKKTIEDTGKISTREFIDVVVEIRKVFNSFGSVFAMAFGDIDEKVETIRKACGYSGADGSYEKDDLIEVLGSKENNWSCKDPSLSRAVNRMCHVVHLMFELFDLLQRDPKMHVGPGLKEVYPSTLAPIHGWIVKKSVGMAFSACPYREDFLKKIGTDESAISGEVPEITANMKVIHLFIKGKWDAAHEQSTKSGDGKCPKKWDFQ